MDVDDSVLKIPLANGNVMNIPLSAINISEEVTKSGIWKHVNQSNNTNPPPEKEKEKVKSKDKKKNPNKSSG